MKRRTFILMLAVLTVSLVFLSACENKQAVSTSTEIVTTNSEMTKNATETIQDVASKSVAVKINKTDKLEITDFTVVSTLNNHDIEVETEASGDEQLQENVIVYMAYVYNKPSRDASRLGQLNVGDAVSVISTLEGNEWLKISYNGRVAYILSSAIPDPNEQQETGMYVDTAYYYQDQAQEQEIITTQAPTEPTETQPATTEAAPETTEATPAATEAAPESTEASPAATEAAPETTEVIPAATEAAPEATEEIPATTEVPVATDSLDEQVVDEATIS